MVCVEQRREELQLGWLGWYETWLQGGRRTCIQASGIALRLLGVWECGSGLFSRAFAGTAEVWSLGLSLFARPGQARHTHVTEFGR
jgi:hypothetical protein